MTDRYSKTAEPVTLTVSLAKLTLEITSAGALLYDADNVDIYISYNGSKPEENITIQAKNARGSWDNLKINSATRPATTPTHSMWQYLAPMPT